MFSHSAMKALLCFDRTLRAIEWKITSHIVRNPMNFDCGRRISIMFSAVG